MTALFRTAPLRQ